jgi:hypothetical protein
MSLDIIANVRMAVATTTDATAGAAALGTLPVQKGGGLNGFLHITLRNTATGAVGGTMIAVTASNPAGTVAALASVTGVLATLSPAGLTTATVAVSATGVVTGTGVVATNIEWTSHFIGSIV